MNIETLQPSDIERMSYNELIGLVRETNRPPGGVSSIARVAQIVMLNSMKKVLEVGTSTGVTAIELVRFCQCEVYGIDINTTSLKEAQERAEKYEVTHYVHFLKDDTTHLSFENDFFDLVFCGNVTSLVAHREKAISEYWRVLKFGGFLAAIPMYYVKSPSKSLIKKVSQAIHIDIVPHDKDYWIRKFTSESFHVFFSEDYLFDTIDAHVIDEFVSTILRRPHLSKLPYESQKSLSRVYSNYMHIFRENLSHMGFTILILRKEFETLDRELFTAKRL